MTPRGLLLRAVLITGIYALLHLCGLRHSAAFLSGTPVGGTLATLGGLTYVLFYFMAVVLAPILVIAAGVLRLLSRAPAKESAAARDRTAA
jgi:hypothetical protein